MQTAKLMRRLIMRALSFLIVLICLHVFAEDEPEHLSWELGAPDNIEEIEIIYDLSSQGAELSFESNSPSLYHYWPEQGHADCIDCSTSWP
jgi:hypothetical protein